MTLCIILRKYIYILHFCLINLFFLADQANLQAQMPPVKSTWNFSNPTANISGVLPIEDGGYIIYGTGFCNEPLRASMQKVSAAGVLLWCINIPFPTSNLPNTRELSSSVISDIIEVCDGYVYVGGTKTDSRGSLILGKINKNGVHQWTANNNWIASNRAIGYSIIETLGERVMIGGSAKVSAGDLFFEKAFLAIYDNNGNHLDTKTALDNDKLWGNSIRQIERIDSSYIILGEIDFPTDTVLPPVRINSLITISANNRDIWLMKFTGNVTKVNGNTTVNLNIQMDTVFGSIVKDEPMNFKIDQSGDLVLLGRTVEFVEKNNGVFGRAGQGYWVVKLDSSGNLKKIIELEQFDIFGSKNTLHNASLELSCDNHLLILYDLTRVNHNNVGIPFITFTVELYKIDFGNDRLVWNGQLPGNTSSGHFAKITKSYDQNIVLAGKLDDRVTLTVLNKENICQGYCDKATSVSCGTSFKNQSTINDKNLINRYTGLTCGSNLTFKGPEKVYKIEINQPVELKVSLEILTSKLDLDLFLLKGDCKNPSSIESSISNNSSSNKEFIQAYLEKGVYYIVVDGKFLLSKGNFNIDFTCGILDCKQAENLECGKPISSNTNQGINNINFYRIKDTLIENQSGNERTYQFSLSQPAEVELVLSNISPFNAFFSGSYDVNLFLLDSCSSNRVIRSSRKSGTQNEQIRVKLNPGIYFVVVDGNKGSQAARYTLSLDISPEIISFTPLQVCTNTEITIRGKNFLNPTVFIRDNKVVINQTSDTLLSVNIPSIAETGRIEIRTSCGSAVSKDTLKISTAPIITSIIPDTICPGVSKVEVLGEFLSDVKVLINNQVISHTQVGTGGNILQINISDNIASGNHIISVNKNLCPPVNAPRLLTKIGTIPKPNLLSSSICIEEKITITNLNNFPEFKSLSVFLGPTSSGEGIPTNNFIPIKLASIVSGSVITATLPPNLTAGRYTVFLKGKCGESERTPLAVLVKPIIDNIVPSLPCLGDTLFIDGKNLLLAGLEVRIGGILAQPHFSSSNTRLRIPLNKALSGTIQVDGTFACSPAQKTGFIILEVPPKPLLADSILCAINQVRITNLSSNFEFRTLSVFLGAINSGVGIPMNTLTPIKLASSISGNQIIATLPSNLSSGNYEIFVKGNCGESERTPLTIFAAPIIDNINPLQLCSGDTLKITGKNLLGTTKVMIGGTEAKFTVVSNNILALTVPAGAASGTVTVSNICGVTSRQGFVRLHPPTIASFTPLSGCAGQELTITGTNLDTMTLVTIGGVQSIHRIVNGNLKVTVFQNASSGPITVKNTCGSDISKESFLFEGLSPVITDFSPKTACTGDQIVIKGKHLGGSPNQKAVWTEPIFPKSWEPVTIYFDATKGTGGLADCNCTIYIHTGVLTNDSKDSSDWKYVKTKWGIKDSTWAMTKVPGIQNLYKFEIKPNIRDFYSIPTGENAKMMAFVFRNENGSMEGKDNEGKDFFIEIASSLANSINRLSPIITVGGTKSEVIFNNGDSVVAIVPKITSNNLIMVKTGCGDSSMPGFIQQINKPIDVGKDIRICYGVPSIKLNALNSSQQGQWSILPGYGTAKFSDKFNPQTEILEMSPGNDGILKLKWQEFDLRCFQNPSHGEDTLSIIFDFPQKPVILMEEKISLCKGNPLILKADSSYIGLGEWLVILGAGTISNPQKPSSKIDVLSTGTVKVKWTIKNGVCPEVSDTLTIEAFEIPTAIAGPIQKICSQNEVKLYAEPPNVGSGKWNIIRGLGQIENSGSPNTRVLNISNTDTLKLKWTVINGVCPPAISFTEVINFKPPSKADPGNDTSICNVNSISLKANKPAIGYGKWEIVTGPGKLISSNDPQTQMEGLRPGEKTKLKWTIENGVCPSESKEILITVDLPASPAYAGKDTLLCGMLGLQLNSRPPLVGKGQWRILSGTGVFDNPLSNTAKVTNLRSEFSTSLAWEVTNGICPSSLDTVIIRTRDLPKTSPSPAMYSVCKNENLLLNPMATTTSDTLIYYWNNGTTKSYLEIKEENKQPNYSVVVRDVLGCETTWEAFVKSLPFPTIYFSDTIKICEGKKAFLQPLVIGGTPPYQYRWNQQSGLNQAIFNKGIYEFEVNDKNNCQNKKVISVEELPLPKINISKLSNPDCSFSDGTIEVSTLSNSLPVNIIWSTGTKGNILDKIPSGKYTVVVNDANNCISEKTIDLSCLCKGQGGIFPDKSLKICTNEKRVISYDNKTQEVPIGKRIWFLMHNEPGNVIGKKIFYIDTIPVIKFTPAMEVGSKYYFSAILSSYGINGGPNLQDSCVKLSSTVEIEFLKVPQLPSLIEVSSTDICIGSTVSLRTNTVNENYTYYWDTPLGFFNTIQPKFAISNFQYKNTGKYQVAIKDSNCISSFFGPLELKMSNDISESFAENDKIICGKDSVKLYGNAPSESSFEWISFGGAKIINNKSEVTTAFNLQNGINKFLWRVITPNCIIEDTLIVNNLLKPKAENDSISLDDKNERLSINFLSNDKIFDIPTNQIRFSIIKQPDKGSIKVFPDNKILYTRNLFGEEVYIDEFKYVLCNFDSSSSCIQICDTAVVRIRVEFNPNVLIYPSIGLTVNGNNPYWQFKVARKLQNVNIYIFNRWGQIVYKENIPHLNKLQSVDFWDGRNIENGTTADTGAYYFLFEGQVEEGNIIKQKGILYLINNF